MGSGTRLPCCSNRGVPSLDLLHISVVGNGESGVTAPGGLCSGLKPFSLVPHCSLNLVLLPGDDGGAFLPSAEESPCSQAQARGRPFIRTYTRKKLLS